MLELQCQIVLNGGSGLGKGEMPLIQGDNIRWRVNYFSLMINGVSKICQKTEIVCLTFVKTFSEM